MSTALIIALVALFTVFIAVRASRTKHDPNGGGDGGSYDGSYDTSPDCGSSDGGGGGD